MTLVAFVLARSGSKGIKDKNLLRLGGRTLLEISVDFANNCELIDRVFISTDSPVYERLGIDAGASSIGLRPAELASDTSKTVDVLIDLVKKIPGTKPETILLLQPTAPFRKNADIANILQRKRDLCASAVVSLYEIDDPHPHKMKQISSEDSRIHPFVDETNSETPRQLLPKVYGLTGSYYLIDTQVLLEYETLFPPNTVAYVMDRVVNIDNLNDYDYAKYIWDKKTNTKGAS